MEPTSLQQWLTQPEGLATRLRNLALRAGLQGSDLARELGWQQSKVSRISTGQQKPSISDIRAWAAAAGATADETELLEKLLADTLAWNVEFRARTRGGQAGIQRDYNKLVADSTLIRHLETVWVPGLVQTPDYARHVFTESRELHQIEVDDVEAALATRLERQRYLYDPAKRFEFLLCEPVLRYLIVPAGVMRAQLDRLLGLAGADRIRLGIVPMGVRLHATPQNSVQVYQGPAQAVAVVETYIGERFCTDGETEQYQRVLGRQWRDAAEGEDARQLIVAAMAALPG